MRAISLFQLQIIEMILWEQLQTHYISLSEDDMGTVRELGRVVFGTSWVRKEGISHIIRVALYAKWIDKPTTLLMRIIELLIFDWANVGTMKIDWILSFCNPAPNAFVYVVWMIGVSWYIRFSHLHTDTRQLVNITIHVLTFIRKLMHLYWLIMNAV